MITRRILIYAFAAGMSAAQHSAAIAQVFARNSAGTQAGPLPLISPIFGDNMVLQRDKPDTVWGWADPGQSVKVEIAEKSASAVAGPDRRWQVKIQPPAVGGPYTLTVTGSQTIELHNVMVGDVWLCSGQSNMQFALQQALNGPEDVKAANNPDIRYFTVSQHAAYHHADVPGGSWKVVSPDTAGRVSAVAYYFARRVQHELHIPIGLVIAAVGGTPAESWTSAAALRKLGDFDVPLAELQRVTATGGPEYGNYVMHWYDAYDTGTKEKWFAPDFDSSSWKAVHVPGGFADLGVPDTPAVVWFRKEIEIPDPVPPGRNMVLLGIIEKMDTVYVNGREVGGSAWVENPRAYFVPQGVLKPGKNTIVIRVFKTQPNGGFMSKAEDLHLVLADKTDISLAGKWQAKVGVDARPPHPLPIGYQNWPVMPSVLYEGMVAPLVPLSVAGTIWYQGEENSVRGYEYRKVLPAMIADWRSAFGQGNFPFYIVSLPAYKQRSAAPTNDAWAETRESQAITVATVPNTCLAITIDTGDADNIHPNEKAPIGDRLARCALANSYGKKILFQGPTLRSVDRRSGSIVLHFSHADGGPIAKGGKLAEFSIAGEDRKWVWADAHIEGDTIVVSSPSVPNPKEVRYAWQSNPMATLFNGEGLPAAPFRTDRWPGITEGQRPY
jgi:sialate O-acetylesterase